MKKIFLIIILNLLYVNFSFADLETKKEHPPFPFTVDDKVKEFDEIEKMFTIFSSTTDIKTDKFWNQPITKLDYILMQIKKHADEKSKQVLNGRALKEYFDKYENKKKYHELFGRYKDIQLDNSVFFSEKSGKILVSFVINDVGKAKKPMSEICENLLKYDFISYPLPDQKIMGYSYHNALLNELYRGDGYENYNTHLKKIADNLVYSLSITSLVSMSKTKKDYDIFTMMCWKPNEDEIEYRKWSRSSREK